MIKSFINKNSYEYYENASLTNYNTYRINVVCNYLIFPKNTDELIDLLKFLKKNNYKFLILGNGSNVIFKNEFYDGVVIRLDRLNKVITDGNLVRVEAGCLLPKLSMDMSMKGLSGLEFASGIPGFIGASVAMNAGAYKKAFSDIVLSVDVINPDGEIITMSNSEIDFDYRDSFFKSNKDYIIVSVLLQLENKDPKEILEKISRRRVKRIESQPLNFPSAGSVFRNPEGYSAGALIEQCGLKNYRIGGAVVSEKHANFIINVGGATGKDIIMLIDLVREKVKEKFNIELILEQIIID